MRREGKLYGGKPSNKSRNGGKAHGQMSKPYNKSFGKKKGSQKEKLSHSEDY